MVEHSTFYNVRDTRTSGTLILYRSSLTSRINLLASNHVANPNFESSTWRFEPFIDGWVNVFKSLRVCKMSSRMQNVLWANPEYCLDRRANGWKRKLWKVWRPTAETKSTAQLGVQLAKGRPSPAVKVWPALSSASCANATTTRRKSPTRDELRAGCTATERTATGYHWAPPQHQSLLRV